MERELLLLAKKYEIKCEEARKANTLVEQLVDRLNRKIERRDFLDTLSSSQVRDSKSDLADELLRILERTELQGSTSNAASMR
jgi:hypothetical protein